MQPGRPRPYLKDGVAHRRLEQHQHGRAGSGASAPPVASSSRWGRTERFCFSWLCFALLCFSFAGSPQSPRAPPRRTPKHVAPRWATLRRMRSVPGAAASQRILGCDVTSGGAPDHVTFPPPRGRGEKGGRARRFSRDLRGAREGFCWLCFVVFCVFFFFLVPFFSFFFLHKKIFFI